MGLKVSCNSAFEAAVPANQLLQGEIGKVVSVGSGCNTIPTAFGKFIVRGGSGDMEGGFLMDIRPRCIPSESLYLYKVVRMPSGTKITLEAE